VRKYGPACMTDKQKTILTKNVIRTTKSYNSVDEFSNATTTIMFSVPMNLLCRHKNFHDNELR